MPRAEWKLALEIISDRVEIGGMQRFALSLVFVLLTACSYSDQTQLAAPAPSDEKAVELAQADEIAPVNPKENAAVLGVGSLVVATDAGDVAITAVYHGTMRLDFAGKVWWLDPWSKGALDGAPKADYLLLTDIHQDHLDEDAIAKVEKEGTVVVAPKAVAAKLQRRKVDHVLANGEQVVIEGVTVKALPMYNNTRGPEPGTLFHDKGRGNGYVLTIGAKNIYIAGDTACTPEMKALSGIDHAFVPMNLPYTMTPAEAAECVKAFRPKVVTPYHYAGSDLMEFSAALEGVEGVQVVIAEFYPGGLPW